MSACTGGVDWFGVGMFVFFEFGEPLALFYIDYIAVMGLFAWIGHYLAKILRKPGRSVM